MNIVLPILLLFILMVQVRSAKNERYIAIHINIIRLAESYLKLLAQLIEMLR